MAARLEVRAYMAWWWRPYAFGVRCMAALTGCEADPDKVQAWANKAVRFEVRRVKAQ
jgi:hypothetical protein